MAVFKKNGNWWIDYYYERRRFTKKVGPSKKLAEMALANVKIKIAKKEFLGIVETKKIFFQEFAVEFLEYSKTNKAFGSFESDRYTVNRILPRWGAMPLQQIDPKMIEDFMTERRKDVAPGTVNSDLTTIKNLFRKAVEWEYLQSNPASGVKFLKTAKSMDRFLSEDEIPLLLESCRQCKCPHLYPVVVVALNTGMRKGEIFNLRWDEVHFRDRRVNVISREQKGTKNHESRSIPMNETVYEVLNRHPRQLGSPYVFAEADGSPIVNVKYHFPLAVNGAGIPHTRFHDLRHTFASHLVMKGVDIRSVQVLMGHKNIQMTMRYSHLAPGHMRAAVEVLDSHYMDTGQRIAP